MKRLIILVIISMFIAVPAMAQDQFESQVILKDWGAMEYNTGDIALISVIECLSVHKEGLSPWLSAGITQGLENATPESKKLMNNLLGIRGVVDIRFDSYAIAIKKAHKYFLWPTMQDDIFRALDMWYSEAKGE